MPINTENEIFQSNLNPNEYKSQWENKNKITTINIYGGGGGGGDTQSTLNGQTDTHGHRD
ncbi:hypothetical protein DERP_012186 [Dermatophagoides pteronyssinus]|uniref:Uncharacterized protein n=1 Tax=Dermatophagoides pteronyssinus TaxID=6956 RepID=A0ABQ8J2G2_DERPT|nr:hypothetical protein DERP_012186 [Dermatophagoides pteronyssinus]